MFAAILEVFLVTKTALRQRVRPRAQLHDRVGVAHAGIGGNQKKCRQDQHHYQQAVANSLERNLMLVLSTNHFAMNRNYFLQAQPLHRILVNDFADSCQFVKFVSRFPLSRGVARPRPDFISVY